MPVGVRINGETGRQHDLPRPDRVPLAQQHVLQQRDRRRHRSPPTFNDHELAARTSTSSRWTTSSRTARRPRPIQDAGQIQGSVLEYNLFFNNGDRRRLGTAQLAAVELPADLGDPQFRNPADGQLPPPAGLGRDRRGPERAEPRPDVQRGRSSPPWSRSPTRSSTRRPAASATATPASRTATSSFGGAPTPSRPRLLTLPGYAGRGASSTSGSRSCRPTRRGSPAPTSNAGAPSTTPRSPASATSSATSGRTTRTGQRRVRQPPVLRHRCLRVPAVHPAARHRRSPTADRRRPRCPTAPAVNIYSVGGDRRAPTRRPRRSRSTSTTALDPTTINDQTVLLEASGGDGIFGNNNSANDRFINLSGKLSFDPTTERPDDQPRPPA